MNSFEYGFFSELEKIATNPELVDRNMRVFGRRRPHESSADRGADATHLAQFSAGTMGRETGDPNGPDGSRFTRTIPNPDDPKGIARRVMSGPERDLSRKRQLASFSPGGVADSAKYMTFPQRRRIGLRAYGL